MIELIDVAKSYGHNKIALSATTATVSKGELVWISGRSGAGKSTLLGIASLLIAPSSGTVRVAGAPIPTGDESARTRLRRELFGIIPQNSRLFPELTSTQNVVLSAERITRKNAEDVLSDVGLRASGARPVKTMSGGEQQRVSIARAIAKRPQVVFADELTSALDDENAHAIWRILRRIVDGGAAVIVASHDPRITEYADRRIELGAN